MDRPGFSIVVDPAMTLTRRAQIIWSWPTGKMRWFMWGWRGQHFFTDTRLWRIGPVTLMVVDG